MSNEYDPIRERLDEPLYAEELEPIREKFTEYLLQHNIDPVNMVISMPVAQGVVDLLGVPLPDWKNFKILDKDWNRKAMETLKSTLQGQLKRNGKTLKATIQKLKAERAPQQAVPLDQIIDQEDAKPEIPPKPEINIGKRQLRKPKDPASGQTASGKLEDHHANHDPAPINVGKIRILDRIVNDEEVALVNRELEINDVVKTMNKHKREFKEARKRYNQLIQMREKSSITELHSE